jgi:hypothetical protein
LASKAWRAMRTAGLWFALSAATAAVLFGLFGPLADLIVNRDMARLPSLPDPQRADILIRSSDAVRGRILQTGAGVLAAAALLYTARNFKLTRQALLLSESGQLTDRFSKAIEQLGSDIREVRLGAIFALERIARDSAADHPSVMDILTTFIRERASVGQSATGSDQVHDGPPVDIQAALLVVGRRAVKNDTRRLDLRGVQLSGAELHHADLSGAFMPYSNFAGCSMHYVNLSGANLNRSNFNDSHLVEVNLSEAKLAEYATFVDAQLIRSNLSGADIEDADFSRAELRDMNLTRVYLATAKFSGADLTWTTVSGQEQFSDALIDADTQMPESLGDVDR